jgi:hypothetical protein
MNERVKQLVKEQLSSCEYAGKESHWYEFDDAELQKFAELIVEECRYVIDCNKGSDQNPAWNQALWETSEKIKQHFGVNNDA